MRYLLSIFLCLITCHVSGQQVIFSENFDHYPGLNIGGGWNSATYTGAIGWRTSDMYDLFCANSKTPQQHYWDRVAAISDCHDPRFGPRNNSNVLLYTPSINLSSVSGAMLQFDSYFNKRNDNGKIESATVEVSVNNGVSWTVLKNIEAGNTDDSFSRAYMNLSAYKGYSNILIGFRYKDNAGDHQRGGWTIDNIVLFEPSDKDIALTKFTPEDSLLSYVELNKTIIHEGTVINYGLDTIHSFVVNYKRENGPALADTFNTTMPPLATYDFTHKVPDTVAQAGTTNLTAWVALVGDKNRSNDTLSTKVRGAHFIPDKLVVIEEGTGTWSGFGPKGIVYMHIINGDYNASLISIHSTDPMDNEVYSDYMYNLKYYSVPYFLVDRHLSADATSLPSLVPKYNKHFGYADIKLHATLNGNELNVYSTVIPAIDIEGDLRLAMVLTEDIVSGTDPGWAQTNFYARPMMQLGPMAGFESAGDPVPADKIAYDFVARKIVPSPDGDSTFPDVLEYGKKYPHVFNTTIDPEWDKNNMLVIVMLLNDDDTTILNSNKLNYFLDITDKENDKAGVTIYPNPANGYAIIKLEDGTGITGVTVTDMQGRVMKKVSAKGNHTQITLGTGTLPSGLYLISVSTDIGREVLKLQVVH